MSRELRIKGSVILLGLLFCLYCIYPTIRWSCYTEKEKIEKIGDPQSNTLGAWKEEQATIPDNDLLKQFQFNVKKWWEGDRDRALNLGLDLQGGLYVILQVDENDAVRVQRQNARELLKDALAEKNVAFVHIADVTNTVIELVFTNTAAAQQALTVIKASTDFQDRLNLPGDAVGPSFRASLKASYIVNNRHKVLEQARRVVENRINELGLTEPSIQVMQDPPRVVVQLPGEKDPGRVLRLLKQTAKLEFRLTAPEKRTAELLNRLDRVRKFKDKLLVESGSTEEGVPYTTYKISDADTEFFRNLLNDPQIKSRVPPDYELMLGRPVPDTQRGGVFRDFALINRDIAIDGMSLKDARVSLRSAAQKEVALSLDSSGTARLRKTSRLTSQAYKMNNAVTRLAIVLDEVIYSAPLLLESIPSGNAVIHGSFTDREAADLALVLRSGALPAKLDIVQNQVVGASLGADSIRKGLLSGLVGMLVVMVFMVVYYLLAGLIANLTLMLNILILLAVLAFFRATLTLPGIAGIILGIGMAVDSNVLIFERIREEQAAGKDLRRAIKDGFARAWITIFDSNLTTIFTALILYFLGTGPIRGFGLTLIISLIANLLTAVFVCRYVFELLATRESFTRLRMSQFFGATKIDFLGKRQICALASIVVITAGMVIMGIRWVNQDKAMAEGKTQLSTSLLQTPIRGIELTGGDMVRLDFAAPVQVGLVRAALEKIGLADSTIQTVGDGKQVLIRSPFNTSGKVIETLHATFTSDPFVVGEQQQIGPAIGEDLVHKATYAMVLSLIVMVIYLWYRFEWEYGIGAMVALAHDVLVTLAFFAFSGRQVSLIVIAALLTIVGYSVNDTIVIFDRVREDVRLNKGMTLKDIMNLANNQCLSRTILTSGTVLFVVLAQYLFGGAVINDFAFALLVGCIAGTYSTVFIAGPVVLFFNTLFKRRA
jgi:SecD/SecF fusion protein